MDKSGDRRIPSDTGVGMVDMCGMQRPEKGGVTWCINL